MMLQTILKYTADIDYVFVFVPIVNKRLMECIEELKFEVDRYSFLLVREDLEVPEFSFPVGYEIIPFRFGTDEEVWCEVRNSSFASLKGSETPITSKIVVDMMNSKDNIEGGSMILYHKVRPIGLIRGTMDEYEGSPIMNIGPLAIIPEYQGKGLGRNLLRASLHFAKEKSYDKTVLCVNAENERAKDLYLQEGFKQVEAVACYKYNLTK
jgi:mycothiol synthase